MNWSRLRTSLIRLLLKKEVQPFLPSQGLRLYRIGSHDQYVAHRARSAEHLDLHMKAIEPISKSDKMRTFLSGYSYAAGRQTQFIVDRGADGQINWRETTNCMVTGFNNRMRAMLQLFDIEMEPYSDTRIYITEQVTPFYAYFANKFVDVTGSEYFGDQLPFGCANKDGVRNETLCALSFPDDSFDVLVSLDVLEHIPDYRRAFGECARVLRPGGRMMWSVPFIAGSPENVVRAKIENEEVVHMLPPEFHGDPLSDVGVLCFQYFGWEMLDQIRAAGFRDAYALCYQSIEFGYLGDEQFMFVARK